MIRKVFVDINNSTDDNLRLLKIAKNAILKEYPNAEIMISCDYCFEPVSDCSGAITDFTIEIVYTLEF